MRRPAARYNQKYPRGFERLQASMGYRLRPSWVWQRKRYSTAELIVCIANRGVAGVPGVLWPQVESPDRKLDLRGALDAGRPYGGGIRQASFLLPQGYSSKIQLSAQLELRPGIKRPVAWACEQPVNADGSITVELKGDKRPRMEEGSLTCSGRSPPRGQIEENLCATAFVRETPGCFRNHSRMLRKRTPEWQDSAVLRNAGPDIQ